jgi:GT2 family glycosyltransferase
VVASRVTRLSVVIPTYARCGSVRRTLEALSRQSLAPSEYEVVVAIDGSDDGTQQMVEGLEVSYALRAVWRPHAGRAAACNAGLRAASSELVVVLDDDMQPAPGFLAGHANAHVGAEDLGVMGAVPVPLDAQASPTARYIGQKFNGHLENLARRDHRLHLRDFYTGNFSIRRATLLQVGLFDEAFTQYGNEDLELSVRLRRAGVRLVYAPEALAYQAYTKDFAALARDTVAKGRTAVLLARKHPETLADLKLATYHEGFPRWRLVRAALLALNKRWPTTPHALVWAVQALERILPQRMLNVVYFLTLDYFYWSGALGEADSPKSRSAWAASTPR